MPYDSIQDLPLSVATHLPDHAQEIYRATFNSAWVTYADRGALREEIARRVAWAAVKRFYRKQGPQWVAR
jgi:cation transport regulator